MTDSGLSTQQLAVICALSTGATTIAAAQEAGVHRNTVNNWRRNSLLFQQAFAHAQSDRALHFREKVEGLFDLALESIEDILADPDTAPSVRLKASLAILALATKPPEPPPAILTGDQPQTLPTQSETVHKNAQPEPNPNACNAPKPPIAPENARSMHKPAQSRNGKIGRNGPCPCGSGQKYKKCCLPDQHLRAELVQRLMTAA